MDSRCASLTGPSSYTEEDKVLLVERIRENDMGLGNKEFKRYQAMEAVRDPVSWMLGVMLFIKWVV